MSSVENPRTFVQFDSDAPTEASNVVVRQEAPKIVGLQPIVEMNLVKMGGRKFFSKLVGFTA